MRALDHGLDGKALDAGMWLQPPDALVHVVCRTLGILGCIET
jgi:hypothetical protein